ncbi:MAG: heavy-metal-associated domain-containing protein [candidate division NC10 bacterium]|nr:heavy-metal-associated domain-containing protein [candidate division NC10 bacterium]
MRNADVSFERGEAVVTYEKGAVSIEQMQEAVARHGFTATLKSPRAK